MERGGTVSALDVAASGAASRRRPLALSARAIVIAYVVVAVLWIALSDQIVSVLFSNPDDRTLVETLKGVGFVAVTGGLLAALLHRYDALRAYQAAELEQRERRYRLLTEHAQDIIFRIAFGPTAATEYLSPAVERMLGYPLSAFDGDPHLFRNLVHPDDRGWSIAMRARGATGCQSYCACNTPTAAGSGLNSGARQSSMQWARRSRSRGSRAM